MPTLAPLQPFAKALATHAGRAPLPTVLDSAGLRALGSAFHKQALVSARTNIESYVNDIATMVEDLINPRSEQRADRITPENPEGNVTVGRDLATARLELKQALSKYGYEPSDAERGTITDLSSDRRINLVLRTNTELAQGVGHFIAQNDPAVLDGYPALQFVRFEAKKQERDWPQRWRIAAQAANDPAAARVLEFSGRMVALKSSEIWQALGDGAGGYEDTLGNPYPPFAFSSGMWTQDVSRAEAIELGLIEGNEQVGAAIPIDLANIFGAPEEAAA